MRSVKINCAVFFGNKLTCRAFCSYFKLLLNCFTHKLPGDQTRPASGRKSLWNVTANQMTANKKYYFSQPVREKKQNLVFQHMVRQVNVSSVSCPPSPHLNTGEGVYDRRLGNALLFILLLSARSIHDVVCEFACAVRMLSEVIRSSFSLQCRRILASEAASLIKRAPSWIQTRKRLGERRKCVPESGRVGVRLKGEVTFSPAPSPPTLLKPIWRRSYDCELQNENACP